MRKYLFILVLLVLLVACSSDLAAAPAVEQPEIVCPEGEMITGCGRGADGRVIVFLAEPLPEGAPPIAVEGIAQSKVEYIVSGEWVLMDAPTPTPVVLDLVAPAQVIINVAAPAGGDVTPEPTIIPEPTATPTALPPVSKVIHPGDSGGGENVGRCTVGFAGKYNIQGSPYYGKEFLITNAHCLVKPHNQSKLPWYSCPTCANKPYYSPGKLDGGSRVGVTAYWYPNNVVTNGLYTYDAGAVMLDPEVDVDNVIKGIGGLVTDVQGIVPVETRLEAYGATGGYRAVKVVAEDTCIDMLVDDAKKISWCAQYIIQGIKPDDNSPAYKPMQPGDSGTLFILRDGKVNKTAVCLGFAGTADMKLGVCSPMDLVLKGMHLDISNQTFAQILFGGLEMEEILIGIQVSLLPKLFVLIGLALLDLILGVLLALVQKRFEWAKLTDYISSSLLPIVGWFAVGLVGLIPVTFIPEQVPVVAESLVYATVFAKILASILGHLSAIGILQNVFSRLGVQPTGITRRGKG